MIKNKPTKDFISPYEGRKREDMGEELACLQRECQAKDIPVIIMVDGWESSGKGYVINDLVRELDAKAADVSVFNRYDEIDDYFYTYQFWRNLPAKGNIAIFDRSMYYDAFNRLNGDSVGREQKIREIKNLEKLLYDDHTIIIKFFLHQSQKEQKEAIERLEKDPYRKFMANEADYEQNENYDLYLDHMNEIMKETDFPFAPWIVVPSGNRKMASKHVLGTSIQIIKDSLILIEEKEKEEAGFVHQVGELKADLESLDLSPELDKDEYKEVISDLQKRAGDLAYSLYYWNVPVVIVFEGTDAAGKGGAIRRLLKHIDARTYDINPTSGPSEIEKDHHYLWRFYNNFPRDGNIAIFDRSWYGRLMVERVEGFANDYEWSRAYEEIRQMENELLENDMILLKYLLITSKEEQAERFKDREEDKPYKINDEDWRNREKWDEYMVAMNEMLDETSTKEAPWHVISGEDKRYARVEVLKIFIDAVEKHLKKIGALKKKD